MRQRIVLSIGLAALTLVGLAILVRPGLRVAHSQAGEDKSGVQGGGGAGYLSIAGHTFVPEGSSTVFKTNAAGGVAVTGSSSRYMHAPVHLPDGAQVSGIRFYYYDNQALEDMTARLFRNNDANVGARTTLALVAPSGATGYGDIYAAVSPASVIDNGRYNYEIEVNWSAGSSDLRVMGVTVYYTNP